MAIKVSVAKLSLEGSFGSFITSNLEMNGVELLPIETDHVARLVDMPFHHRDPFDRLLVAQCLTLDMTIVSADTNLDRYGVRRVW